MTYKELEKAFTEGRYSVILDFAIKSKKDDTEIWSKAMELKAQLNNIETLKLDGTTPSEDLNRINTLFVKACTKFLRNFFSEDYKIIFQNKILSIEKEKEIYKFTWYAMPSYSDYIYTFAISMGIIYSDAFGNTLVKVLVDNRFVDEEAFKIINFRLVTEVDKIFLNANFKQNFVIFTVYKKENAFLEAVIGEIYKKGKLEYAFYVDYDIALLKLEKYEG